MHYINTHKYRLPDVVVDTTVNAAGSVWDGTKNVGGSIVDGVSYTGEFDVSDMCE